MDKFAIHIKMIKHKMFRVKSVVNLTKESRLDKCLTTFDLILLAIGSTVGSGIYVMTGIAIKDIAGSIY